jgi:hypothetical protein
MTDFLDINGWRVPVRSCELKPFELGTRDRAVDGTMMIQRRGVKRRWAVQTALMQWIDANALWNLVQGRGHQWRFNGTTNPQDTTASNLASAGGLQATNSPTYTIETRTAADGSAVKWMYSTTAAADPTAFGSGALYVSPGYTNLCSSAHATGSSAGWSTTAGMTVSTDTNNYWQGTGSVKCVTTGTSAIYRFETTTTSQVYTYSAYVKPTANNTVIGFNIFDGSGSSINLVSYTLPTAGVWYRVFNTFTAASTSTRPTPEIVGATTVYMDGFMLTNSTHPAYTHYTWVDGTRAASDGPLYPPAVISSFSSWTCSAWCRGQSRSSNYDVLVEFMGASSSVSRGGIYIDTSGYAGTFVENESAQSTSTSYSSALVPAASWHHIVGVFDAVNKYMYLYVNGTLRSSSAWVYTNPNYSSNAYLSIGDAPYGTAEYTVSNGIDEVTILPYAAPANLVTAMYSSSWLPWSTLPLLRVEGDAIDGVASCIGNVSSGTFARVMRTTGDTKNNFALSFELEEV